LKISAISRLPVWNLVACWSTVPNIFQPSDEQKILRELYDACEQEENQTGTAFLQLVERKASELRKLG